MIVGFDVPSVLLQTPVELGGLLASNMSKESKQFILEGEDEYSDVYAISIAINCVRQFLGDSRINARQVIGLGHALYALERLPTNTPGSFVEFGVEHSVVRDFPGTRYLSFFISESTFEISRGGSINMGAGYDNYSDPGWLIEIGGYRDAECELYYLEDEIAELLALGAEITVYDESNIEYD